MTTKFLLASPPDLATCGKGKARSCRVFLGFLYYDNNNIEAMELEVRCTRQKAKRSNYDINSRERINAAKTKKEMGISKDMNDLGCYSLASRRPNLSESESSEDDFSIAELQKSLKGKKNTTKRNAKGVKVRSVEDKLLKSSIDAQVVSKMEGSPASLGDSLECKHQKELNRAGKLRPKKSKDEAKGNEIGEHSSVASSKMLSASSRRQASKKKIAHEIEKKEEEDDEKQLTVFGGMDYDGLMELNPGVNSKKDVSTSEDDSENDWEDVHEADISKSMYNPSPKKKVKVEPDFKDIAINLKVNSIHKSKSEKNRELYRKYLERTMRKFQQDLQLNKHKDHLLCLVARAIFLNRQCNNVSLQAICLSLVPWSITKIKIANWDIIQLKKLLNWFQTGIPDSQMLLASTDNKNHGIKLSSLKVVSRSQELQNKAKKLEAKTPEAKTPISKTPKTNAKAVSSPYFKTNTEVTPQKDSKRVLKGRREIMEKKTIVGKKKVVEKEVKKSGIESGDDNDDDNDDDETLAKTLKRSSSRISLSTKLAAKARGDLESPSKRRRLSKSPIKPDEKKTVEAIDDDDDFEKTATPFSKKQGTKMASKSIKKISSDSETEEPKKKKTSKQMTMKIGCDIWVEVYMESLKRWVCVELNENKVDEPRKCEKMATQPLQYVIGIDNGMKKCIKDVTCRYAANFLTKTRKLRVDREWWAETLKPYETGNKKLEELEDTDFHMELMKRPFPATIAEFKNHPLYVVEGDLLKFEAIYPESPAILGYVRGKAIYSRECVHILHTRENWLKEARVVKQGENAYKIVKGRPKRSTPIHERDKVKIDLFGLWQTEIYKPPPITNGKVPRNEYGNVELFKPSMLPPGGVHIPIQGIHKVAKKLNIDAAPAMMGWDFHSGCAHPIIEGVVVAKEYEEKLLDAWQKAEEEFARKKKEKRLQKIYDAWKLLVKGLLVRERIKRKYDFREHDEMEHKLVNDEDNISADLAVSWPLNKMGMFALNVEYL
eukprot:gene6145-6851_t